MSDPIDPDSRPRAQFSPSAASDTPQGRTDDAPSAVRSGLDSGRASDRRAASGTLFPGAGRPASILHDDIEKVLINEEQITEALDLLGREIVEGFGGQEFTAVAVLKGAAVFVSDLIRRVPVPLELAFLMASSYRKGTTAGKLDLDFFPNDAEIEGRRMLLVDDILDTGQTMFTLKRALLERGAADVKTAVFLDKPARRAVEFQADFRCFEIEDKFVVGYGLDFAGRYRNLPYVGALKPEIFQAALGQDA